MKKTSIILLAAVFSAFHFPLSAQDAVYKLLRYEWTVNADGTSDYHYRHEVQILRNRALTAYADKGETFVVYNPDLEDLTVNEVYTLRADGSRVDMPQNAFIYQLPSQCADCGRFNHLRELAMVHTGMELGCTIVVDYTVHRRYNLVSRTIDLVQDCPVERLEVSVKVPEDQELTVKLSDPGCFEFKPVVEQTAYSYSLKADNVPQSYSDSYLPAKEQLYPMLRFYNGTPEFVPAFDNNGLAEAKIATGKAMSGSGSRENLLLLRNYVVDNIHLNNIDPAMLAYKHATAAEVWQTGCGTPADKAVLLAAILNEWGYVARVMDDHIGEVGVMIDTLEYRLSAVGKSPMTLYGEAKDEVVSQNINTQAEASFDTLADGFYRLQLPGIPGAPEVSARNLAITRMAPLQSSACDLQSDITIVLPKGMKMVDGAVKEKLSFDGVGSVEISIKQSGKKLRVQRNLKLEKSLVPVADYDNFRHLLVLWQHYDGVLMHIK